jgi:hypothetical protein
VGQPACPYLRPDHFYFSTLDGRMLVSTDDGQTWFTAAESQSSRWVSLFFTRGRADNVEILAAYDPYRRGLVLSSSRLRTATWRSENKGLYVGSYVKSGASCAANANGTTYYIVLNNALWTARRTRTRPDGPMVVQARCLPATIWVPTDLLRTAQATLNRHIEDVAEAVASESAVGDIAQAIRTANQRKADLNITVQARVEHPKGRSALKVVTADLTVLGGRPDAELLDDGKHGDGPAGDGLWAATFPFNPTAFDRLPEHDRRWPLPGVTAITVSAIDTSGASDSWSAAVSVQRRPEPVSIHPLAIGYRFGSVVGDGPVDLHDDGANALLPRHAALCFTASKPGAWRAARIAGSGVNIIGCQTLSFYIKGDLSQDLYVQLVDRYQVGEDLVDEPHFSRPVNLISGGYLKAITPKYQQVRIPISALLPKGALFLPRHAAGIALGAGPDGKPGKYYLDQAYALP